MVNHNISNYFNKFVPVLLALSLILAPAPGKTAEEQPGYDNSEDNNAESDAADNHLNSNSEAKSDTVLDDNATKWIWGMARDLPEATDVPVQVPKNDNISEKKSTAPIVVEADQLSYNDETGSILAQGQVLITRSGSRIETEEINGNSKLGQVWTEVPVSFMDTETKSNFVSDNIFYDYNLKEGYMGKTAGQVDNQYITGEHIDLGPEKHIITNGTATRCPAQKPDYHISASKIEIWPGDKMILHKAKFWIKNKIIYSMDKYQVSLKKGKEGEVPFPKVGYKSSDGVYIKWHLERPLNQNTSIFTNFDYYTKHHFKPSYGIKYEQPSYTAQIVHGHYQDSDDHWIKKSPEFMLNFRPRKIGSMPLTYRIGMSYGKWDDGSKQSWHQNYKLYIRRDPIKLSKSTNLYLGTGVEHIRESYDSSTQNVYRYDATVTKRFNSRLNAWVSYYHRNYQRTALFSYDTPDVEKEIYYGFTYKIDRLNTIGISYSYDAERRYHKDINYTWYRNLHCWETALTYKSKPRTWEWNISLARW